MQKVRVKVAGGSPALLPVSVAAGRLHGADLYRTASSGTPSKWRRSSVGPLRRSVQLLGAALLLLVLYQALGGGGPVLQQPGRRQLQPVEQQQQAAHDQRQAEHDQRQELLHQHQQGDSQLEQPGQQQEQREQPGQQQAARQAGTGQATAVEQQQPQQQATSLEQQQQQQVAEQQATQQQATLEQQQQQQATQQQAAQQEQHALAEQAGSLQGLGAHQPQAVREQQAAVRQGLERQQQRQRAAAERYAGPLQAPPPKVALLFLVRGNMPLEAVWREFFATAGQIEPVALPPPFGVEAAAAQQQQQQRQQRRRRRRRLAAEAAGAGEALASLPQDGAGVLAVGGKGRQLPDDVRQDRWEGEQRAQAADQQQQQAQGEGEQQAWPPLTEFQKQQVEANQQLAKALGEGEVAQQALEEARAAQTMAAPRSMLSPVDPSGAIATQDLFSVYVHTLPGFYYPNTSIFSGYQIDRRVYVRWGQYTVAEAERRLIWAALQEPRNQRFVLVSETCTPLYPPHVFYLQLLSETRSRVNACAPEDGSVAHRWNSALYMPGVLGPPRWRKSSQWKALVRHHAQLVVADRHLAPRFERECYSYLPPKIPQPPYVAAQNRTWVERTCVSDEHYIPTLLAVHGQDARTTCADALTAADWVQDLWSPLVHSAAEVDAELVTRLRKERWSTVDCKAAEAAASAATMFRRRGAAATLAGRPIAGLGGGGGGGQEPQVQGQQQAAAQQHRLLQQAQEQRYVPLADKCYLLARKFTPDSVLALLALARDCRAGTGISAECLPGRQQAR